MAGAAGRPTILPPLHGKIVGLPRRAGHLDPAPRKAPPLAALPLGLRVSPRPDCFVSIEKAEHVLGYAPHQSRTSRPCGATTTGPWPTWRPSTTSGMPIRILRGSRGHGTSRRSFSRASPPAPSPISLPTPGEGEKASEIWWKRRRWERGRGEAYFPASSPSERLPFQIELHALDVGELQRRLCELGESARARAPWAAPPSSR